MSIGHLSIKPGNQKRTQTHPMYRHTDNPAPHCQLLIYFFNPWLRCCRNWNWRRCNNYPTLPLRRWVTAASVSYASPHIGLLMAFTRWCTRQWERSSMEGWDINIYQPWGAKPKWIRPSSIKHVTAKVTAPSCSVIPTSRFTVRVHFINLWAGFVHVICVKQAQRSWQFNKNSVIHFIPV